MTTENAPTASTETAAAVAEQGATVAPEKASSKKTASPHRGAPKSQKNAKGRQPKAPTTAKPKKTSPARKATKALKQATTSPANSAKRDCGQTFGVFLALGGALVRAGTASTNRADHSQVDRFQRH